MKLIQSSLVNKPIVEAPLQKIHQQWIAFREDT